MDVTVKPVTSAEYGAKANRPSNSRLSKEKLSKNGFSKLPSWQDALHRYLEELAKDRTTITIAHRLSTIRHCDRILVLDKGKIVEDGNYDELIAQNGFFAELVARQRVDNERLPKMPGGGKNSASDFMPSASD